jgi:hypothetical protein
MSRVTSIREGEGNAYVPIGVFEAIVYNRNKYSSAARTRGRSRRSIIQRRNQVRCASPDPPMTWSQTDRLTRGSMQLSKINTSTKTRQRFEPQPVLIDGRKNKTLIMTYQSDGKEPQPTKRVLCAE